MFMLIITFNFNRRLPRRLSATPASASYHEDSSHTNRTNLQSSFPSPSLPDTLPACHSTPAVAHQPLPAVPQISQIQIIFQTPILHHQHEPGHHKEPISAQHVGKRRLGWRGIVTVHVLTSCIKKFIMNFRKVFTLCQKIHYLSLKLVQLKLSK